MAGQPPLLERSMPAGVAARIRDSPVLDAWVFYRNTEDQVVACSDRLTGPTMGDERGFRPSERYPVVPLGGMVTGGWLPDQSTAEPSTATDYTTLQLFATGCEVASVQVRVVVRGTPGPWFVAEAHGGFVVVPLSEPGPVPLSRTGEPEVSFERQAFDRSGQPVAIK